jgi:hypothetical protein
MPSKTVFASDWLYRPYCWRASDTQRKLRQIHKGSWPIRSGHNYQPTENELRSSHIQDVTPNEARVIDRLYDQLLATNPATHK